MNININFNGFATLLTIAFIVLKLCGIIAWSWWWVLSPILICIGLGIATIVIGLFLCIIGALPVGANF